MKWLKLIALLLCTAPAIVYAQANPANPAAAAQGVYYLSNGNNTVPSPFPSGEHGFTNRIAWKLIEPSCDGGTDPASGCFTWTLIDNTLTNLPAGKVVDFDITTGVFTPNWELNEEIAASGETQGTGTCPASAVVGTCPGDFQSTWADGFTPGSQNTTNYPTTRSIVACGVFEIPIPWDPVYLANLNNMLTALRTHIQGLANKAAVARIDFDPISYDTGDENFLYKRTSITTITCTGSYTGITSGNGTYGNLCASSLSTCAPPNTDVNEWQAVGYTPNQVKAGWDAAIPIYQAQWPDVVISAAFADGLMPKIDNSGTITGATGDDTAIKFTLIPDFIAGMQYDSIQTNGCQWTIPSFSLFPFPFVSQVMVGCQSTGDGEQANMRQLWNQLIQGGVKYYELYPNDSTNASLLPAMIWANAAMQGQIPPLGQR